MDKHAINIAGIMINDNAEDDLTEPLIEEVEEEQAETSRPRKTKQNFF